MATSLETTAPPTGQATAPSGNARVGPAGQTRLGSLTPYLFIAPYLALFTIFVLIPAVFGIWISLHRWDFLLPVKPFVGLKNYLDLFNFSSSTGEPFWEAMRATALFVVASVPFMLVIPLGIAMVLNKKFPGRTFFRAVYFAPYVLGVAVVGVLWRFILDPNSGLVNYLLSLVGVDPIPWTTAQPWAWISLVLVTVWWTLGLNTVIYLAGLQEISKEVLEAADIDGATPWQRFRLVTLPSLKRVLVFVITITVLASANMFGQSLLVTQGGPGTSTRTAIMFIAQEGLGSFRMGPAAAMSYVLALFLGAISLAIFYGFRSWGED